ncbi:AzlD domain-containing protein [Enterococcus sp. BWB1-3]|uniref:AzlD domain-containing protein n=1 Tax=unclassified Enterococcus TaxID=2608891 RepID=UPI001921A4EE|nr:MULTISPECIES: AzlD domain-containing protein [unclassified Enterococcus]MBL1229580.1 AzlD domain-containing protein [Enterococcus sp. BWB1-3]MCB5950729.1 AzlD domain-containing protein [Enterococcus sp. BWT-B8]MCB5955968.1 AzlD domain-containing protein [Enterococcus sp. CWB-B31]
MMNSYVLMTILGCSLVTWIPRIVPFILTKKMDFPEWLLKFLSYLPICILTALLLQSMLTYKEGSFPTLKVLEAVSCIPTLLVAVRTKDLMRTVITGIVTIALLRLIF